MGRTGSLFAYEQYGIQPDIVTLGKGIGGGVPLAAMLTSESVSCFEPGDQGGTYNGNPLACAAGLAVLDILLAKGFLEEIRKRATYLNQQLFHLSEKYDLGEVRGRGLLCALETAQQNAPALVAMAFERGLLLNAPRPTTLRFMPALNVSEEEIDQMIKILDDILSENQSSSHEGQP